MIDVQFGRVADPIDWCNDTKNKTKTKTEQKKNNSKKPTLTEWQDDGRRLLRRQSFVIFDAGRRRTTPDDAERRRQMAPSHQMKLETANQQQTNKRRWLTEAAHSGAFHIRTIFVDCRLKPPQERSVQSFKMASSMLSDWPLNHLQIELLPHLKIQCSRCVFLLLSSTSSQSQSQSTSINRKLGRLLIERNALFIIGFLSNQLS